MKTMKKTNWFWPWNDEKEGKWLSAMSAKGWHLKEIKSLEKWITASGPGGISNGDGFYFLLPLALMPGRYVFEQGEPQEYIYRLDYFSNGKDNMNYLKLYEDAGWKNLGRIRGWQYFRCPAGESPREIYTDIKSKLEKYKRILLFHSILAPALISLFMLFGIGSSGIRIGVYLSGFVLFTYLFSAIRLLMRINCIKKNP